MLVSMLCQRPSIFREFDTPAAFAEVATRGYAYYTKPICFKMVDKA